MKDSIEEIIEQLRDIDCDGSSEGYMAMFYLERAVEQLSMAVAELEDLQSPKD